METKGSDPARLGWLHDLAGRLMCDPTRSLVSEQPVDSAKIRPIAITYRWVETLSHTLQALMTQTRPPTLCRSTT